jgi:choline dehydrogenase-like flavoprotein
MTGDWCTGETRRVSLTAVPPRIDARTIEPGTELAADLAIVGAGPAGITVARELAGSRIRVLLVESGGEYPEPEARRLAEGRSVGYPYHPLARARVRAFGGTSSHWETDTRNQDDGWLARPLDAIDFEAREGLPYSGWPIGFDDLEPYYRRAQVASGLGAYRYDAASFASAPPPTIVAPGLATRVFQLGSTNFTGYLSELEASPNVQALLHATVQEVVLGPTAGAVERLRVVARRGTAFSVRATIVVIAAGAIDAPRLLLDSRSVRAAGVGNEHDLVGRFFMERLMARSGYIAAASSLNGAGMAWYRQRVVEGQRVRAAVSLDADSVRREGLPNATAFVVRRPRFFASEGARSFVTLYRAARREPRLDGLRGHARNVIRYLPDLARTGLWVARRGRREEGDTLLVAMQAEQRPNPESRVELDTDTDEFGMHRPRLRWLVTDEDRASVRRTQDLIDDALAAAHLGRLRRKLGTERPPALFVGGFHHMGTARMAPSPRDGVVDANSRVHSVANLYVAGSAVFPTSGYANPTLTIVALAIRLADHLKTRLGVPAPVVGG